MVNCEGIAALDNSIDFLKIYDGKRPYYGGAQKWFKDETLKKVGCSIVAGANITAYLSLIKKNKALYDYSNMSKENFLEHMESLSKYIHPDAAEGVTSVTYFDDKVAKFAKDKGVILKPHYILTEDYFENVKTFIKDSLIEDRPVALLMLANDKLKEFDYHWMTVTKLFENYDKTYVDFSSWGERRIFTLENFYNYSSFGALCSFEPINL